MTDETLQVTRNLRLARFLRRGRSHDTLFKEIFARNEQWIGRDRRDSRSVGVSAFRTRYRAPGSSQIGTIRLPVVAHGLASEADVVRVRFVRALESGSPGNEALALEAVVQAASLRSIGVNV